MYLSPQSLFLALGGAAPISIVLKNWKQERKQTPTIEQKGHHQPYNIKGFQISRFLSIIFPISLSRWGIISYIRWENKHIYSFRWQCFETVLSRPEEERNRVCEANNPIGEPGHAQFPGKDGTNAGGKHFYIEMRFYKIGGVRKLRRAAPLDTLPVYPDR